MSNDLRSTMPRTVAGMTTLTPGAKLLYSALCYFASETGTNECSVEHKELSSCVGRTVRSVQNYLRDLSAAGLIRVSASAQSRIRTYHILPRTTHLKSPTKSRRSGHDPKPHAVNHAATASSAKCA